MLRFGIIGMNEGNGHPYSFSAIFNGYEEEALKECPFEAIRTYLPAIHKNRHRIMDAQVTHVWTQDRQLSERIARVSRIPQIVDRYEEMIGEVDAVILARDDPENHWRMAKPFLEEGVPIYVDKVLSNTLEDLRKIIDATGPDYPLMAGSSSRYTTNIEIAKKQIDVRAVRAIHGISNVSWIRYGNHLLDGICHLFGPEIETVQNLGEKGHDLVHLTYCGGLQVILEVVQGLSLPIEFTCYSSAGQNHYKVVFTDMENRLESYFWGFYRMLETFTEVVKTGKPVLPFSEIVQVSKVIIAGEISRDAGGRKIHLQELKGSI